MASMARLTATVETAVTLMTEASGDLKWLRNFKDPAVAAKAEELSDKLEAAMSSLKSETDTVTPEPEVEPPVEELPVEEPMPTEFPVEDE